MLKSKIAVFVLGFCLFLFSACGSATSEVAPPDVEQPPGASVPIQRPQSPSPVAPEDNEPELVLEPELRPNPEPMPQPVSEEPQSSPAPDAHEESEVQLEAIGNPAPADFIGQDFFVLAPDLIAVNAANIDWVMEYSLVEGRFLGEIARTGVEGNFSQWDATHLPVGTRIYEHSERPSCILIAINGDVKVRYFIMREG